jgi:hypothetical protein
MTQLTKFAVMGAAGALLVACGDSGTSGGNGPGTTPVVSFNLAARPATTGAARVASLAEPYTITDASGNTLTFEKVEMVLREIELKRADRDVVCGEDDSNSDDDSNDDSSSSSSSDDCEELEFGPVLIDLPLGGGAAQVFTVEVAAGTYDELEFEIHKPEDDGDADDAAFLAAHPDFRRISIRVTGTYNGTPFTYTTDLSEEQERALVPPLSLSTATSTDLTLFVDVDTWFRTSAGTLLDPASANEGGANESVVENNIENSIDAFEDDDRDGDDDDADDDGSDDDDGTPDQGSGDN